MHLTPREKQALDLYSQGHKRETCAALMQCSVFTFDFHLRNARKELGVQTSLAAVVFFVRQPADFRSYEVQQLMQLE